MALIERWQPIDHRTDPDDSTYTYDPNVYVDTVGELMALLQRPAWHAQAACRGQGPAKWFPSRGVPVEPGRNICHTCPVREDCLAVAMADGMALGTWGGTTAKDRKNIRNGRPVRRSAA